MTVKLDIKGMLMAGLKTSAPKAAAPVKDAPHVVVKEATMKPHKKYDYKAPTDGKERSIKELIETLPEPYRSQAIANATYDLSKFKYRNAQEAIGGAFSWTESPEGYSYWADVSNWTVDKADLPPPPPPKPEKKVVKKVAKKKFAKKKSSDPRSPDNTPVPEPVAAPAPEPEPSGDAPEPAPEPVPEKADEPETPPEPAPSPPPPPPKPCKPPTPPEEPKAEPKPPPPEYVGTHELAQRVMIVNVHVKLWEGKRTDSSVGKKIIREANANDDAGNFVKNLINRDKYIKPIEKIRTLAKATLYKYTMPWGYGSRVVTVDAFKKLSDEIQSLMTQFEYAVGNFIAQDYDTAKEEAATILGDLYKEGDYPEKSALNDKFAMHLDVTPFPTEIKLKLPDDVLADIKKNVEDGMSNKCMEALNLLVNRLDKALSDFAEKVRKDPKEWHDCIVQNLKDMLDIAPSLNVTNDATLMKVIDTAKTRLKVVLAMDTKEVRSLVETTRTDFAKKAATSAEDIRKLLLG